MKRRYRWHTFTGAILMFLYGLMIIMPEIYLKSPVVIEGLGKKKDISGFMLARWLWNAKVYDSIETTFKIWGCLIYIPFMLAVIFMIFMIFTGYTFPPMVVSMGSIGALCEVLKVFYISHAIKGYDFDEDRSSTYRYLAKYDACGFTIFIYLFLAFMIIVFGILCMTVWREKRAVLTGNRKSDGYIYGDADVWSVGDNNNAGINRIGHIKGVSGQYTDVIMDISPGEEIVMGRDSKYSMLIIDNPVISRKHCGIRYDAFSNCYYAIDYSSHGTLLSDGRKLTTSEYTSIEPGSVIMLADGVESFLLM